MEPDLEYELAAADPAATPSTAAVRDALSQLIDATESATRERGRRVTRAAVAATALAAMAGAGTAAATGLLGWSGTGWWDAPGATTQQVTNGGDEDCRVTYAPRAVHDARHPVPPEQRDAAMAMAAKFLAAFDSATLAGLSPDEVSEELNAQLRRALSQQGLSDDAVSVAVATDCAAGAKR